METIDNKIQTKEEHPLCRVSKTSKYLSLFLLIVLPFVGGIVGYNFAAVNKSAGPVATYIGVSERQENSDSSIANDSNTPLHSPLYIKGAYISTNPYALAKTESLSVDSVMDLLSASDDHDYVRITERVSMDIRPFSNKKLGFDIEASRSLDGSLYSDQIVFDSESGLISLYRPQIGENWPLVQIHKNVNNAQSDTEIEKMLEDIALQDWKEKWNKNESELDAYVAMYTDENSFRELCKLRVVSNTLEDRAVYLQHDYQDVEDGDGSLSFYYLCGDSTTHRIIDNLLIEEHGRSIDAMDPVVHRVELK